jgi:NADH-quinone oxidoreductase subunit J
MTEPAVLAQEAMSGGEQVTFWILAPLAVLGAVGMVSARNALRSALWLVLTMLSLGVFYVLQSAPFLGAVQVIVYTGAVMMLFLFVLMLVGRDVSDSLIETLRGQRTAAIALGVGLAGLGGAGLFRALRGTPVAGLEEVDAAAANVAGLADLMFGRWVLAFEVTGALLITAAVASLLLAHVTRPRSERPDQPELMRARFAPGNYPGPKAGPGVIAASTSVGVPAILPDGSPSTRSLSPILPARELTAAEVAPKETER